LNIKITFKTPVTDVVGLLGEEQLSPKFLVVGKLSEIFFAKNFSFKNATLGTPNFAIWAIWGKIIILSTYNLICRKFAIVCGILLKICSVCRKIAAFCPYTFSTHDAAKRRRI